MITNSLKKLAFSCCVAVAGLMTAPAQAADYVLDDQHTSVVFATSHFGLSYCYGMFGKFNGEFSVDSEQDPSLGSFRFAIDVASLDTKVEKRDQHLLGPDFFNAKQFPEITFTSTGVQKNGKILNVTGQLQLHGQTKTIVLPLTHVGTGKGPAGDDRIGFFARAEIKRSEFGMTTFLPNVGDTVTLMISFEGIKK